MHNNGADETVAIATKLGTGLSTPAINTVLVGGGAGTSSWTSISLASPAVVNTLPVSKGGTGTTTSTGTGDVVLGTSPTIATPTISNPTISGTISGGPTITAPTITSPSVTGTVSGGATYSSPSLNTPIITTPTIRSWDGWLDANETWTFSSATAITVPSDATTKYAVGDKIKLTQLTVVKYFYIVAVTATTLTITGGTDYTFTNNPVTSNAYSHAASPLNFPQWFTYLPVYTGFSADPTGGMTRFCVTGRTCLLDIRTSSGTSNATTYTLTAPITSKDNGAVYQAHARTIDNGTTPTTPGLAELTNGSTTINAYKDAAGNAWTGSSTKVSTFQLTYEI